MKGTVFINAAISSPIWNPQVVHMLRACGSHSRWKQHYWGDYTLRKGSLSFWDQFLANIAFSVFTWRVRIARTSNFITKMFTWSEHLLRRLCCFREIPGAVLFGWWGYPADRGTMLRKLTSMFSKQEGASCVFLCVCCMPINLNSGVLQSHC